MSNGLWVNVDDLPDDLAESEFAVEACEAASFILWGMSGRKWSGVYSVTERYDLRNQDNWERIIIAPGSLTPLPINYPYSVVGDAKVAPMRIRLRGKPVWSVSEVMYVTSEEVFDTSNYTLYDHSFLEFPFPLDDDVSITYSYGRLPPAAGRMAARALAIQFALLWGDREEECTLPDRVTNVTRQGVTWTLLDNQDFIAELRTGIYSIDLFLKTVNPDKARLPAKVFSVDIPHAKRRVPGC